MTIKKDGEIIVCRGFGDQTPTALNFTDFPELTEEDIRACLEFAISREQLSIYL